MPSGVYIRKTRPVLDRFWDKVSTTPSSDDCWPWTEKTFAFGYGAFWDGTHTMHAHRFLYIAINGPIPDDRFVCHRCDNPPCCNPGHLFLGTPKDNADDMVSKGRYETERRDQARPRGDAHYSRISPEKLARGKKNGSYTKPENRPRGEKHGMTHLKQRDVNFIRSQRGIMTQRQLAKRFNVTQPAIYRIQNYQVWT